MKNKKFSFIDLADDQYIEENILNDEIPKKNEEKEKYQTKILKEEKIIKNNSINSNIFFQEKEKLDVKTNIYLKKENYNKIEEIYKKTGNSRSSIINKLIEIALSKINNDN